MPDEILRLEIAKLELRKDDIVVVKTEMHLTKEQAETLRDRVKSSLPADTKCVVLTSGVTLEVVRGEPE